MRPLSEEELRASNLPSYEKKVKEMEASEKKLLKKFTQIAEWPNADRKDLLNFLRFCHVSLSVGATAVGKTLIPSEPEMLFAFDLWYEAQKKIIEKPFRVRMAKPQKNDTCIRLLRPRVVNSAAWHRSEPRGEYAVLCSLFGYERFGYINPSQTETKWLQNVGEKGNIPLRRINNIRLEKTDTVFFEHNLYIIRIEI